MALTRKHFIDLAEVVVEMDKYGLNGTQLEELTQSIGFICRKHNHNFDYTRFEDYILGKLDRKEFYPMTKKEDKQCQQSFNWEQ